MLRKVLHALVWANRHRSGFLATPEHGPLLPRLKPDDVFLDVGAHGGRWAIPISRALPSGHVYAFEALPYYAEVLKILVTLFGRRNVTVVAGAVSDGEGEVDLVWKDAAGERLTGRTHIRRDAEPGETVRVPTITIDGFRRQHPRGRVALLKCDVEGAELAVLRGAVETIDRSRPLVFCELYERYCAQYGYSATDIFSFFSGRRYRPMQFAGGVFRPLDPDAYAGEGDVLFVPAEQTWEAACA